MFKGIWKKIYHAIKLDVDVKHLKMAEGNGRHVILGWQVSHVTSKYWAYTCKYSL